MKLVLLFLAFLLLVSSVRSEVIQYDPSVDCSTVACDLGTGSIWKGGIAPTANDSVEIIAPVDGKIYNFTVTQNNSLFEDLFIQNSELHILVFFKIHNNFTAENSNVTVHAGSVIPGNFVSFLEKTEILVMPQGSLANLGSSAYSYIYLSPDSALYVHGIVLLSVGNTSLLGSLIVQSPYANNTSLTLFGNITFGLYGNDLSNCTYAPKYALITTLVDLHCNVVIPDNTDYIFPAGASFKSLAIGANSSVTIVQSANVGVLFKPSVELFMSEGSVLNLTNVSGGGIYLPTGALGTIVVNSCNLYFVGDQTSSSPAVLLSFFGPDNSVQFSNAVLKNFAFSSDATVNIQAVNLTLLNDNPNITVQIPGNISVASPMTLGPNASLVLGYLTINGPFAFSGGLSVSYGSYFLSLNNTLTFEKGVSVQGAPHRFNDLIANMNISGTLNAPQVALYNLSSLRAMGNLQINGDLLNQAGLLQLDQDQFVLVNGTYTQGAAASVAFFGLDASANSTFNTSARLAAVGNATIAGNVAYTYNNMPKNSRYAVLQTLNNSTINGTFASRAQAINGSVSQLNFDYETPNIIYVVNNISTGGLKWYYKLIIGLGVGLVVGIIVILLVTYTRRKSYRSV